MDLLTQFLAFIVTILVLVSFHEAGHFVVAKLLGIKVLRFSVGFGKALFRFYDKKGTEYVLAMIPLGGYVKLLDEREVVVPEAEKHLAFNHQPLWARTLVVLAGPLTNILFAILAFWFMFMIGITALRPIVGAVEPNSIAAIAGLQKGDEILKVDGRTTPSFQKVLLAIVERLGEKTSMNIEAKNPQTNKTTLYQLNLKNWTVDNFNPEPLGGLGITPIRPNIPPIIEEVEPNSVASEVGLLPKDRVLSINGQPIKDWYQFVKYIHLNPGKSFRLVFERDAREYVAIINIQQKRTLGFRKIGYIGVKPMQVDLPASMTVMQKYPPMDALVKAVQETWQFVVFNAVILKKMITGQVSLGALGGPLTIFATADAAFAQGVSVFLGFLALISVMLAFVNILPIPGLDGGHLFNYLIEFIIRRPLSLKYEIISVQVGMFLLILIMIVGTLNDILRYFFAP